MATTSQADGGAEEERHALAGIASNGKIPDKNTPAALRDAALLLEPEMRTLHGVLVALRHLGERADPIEPAAIAVLAAVGENALAQVTKVRSDMEQSTTPAAASASR